MYRVWTIQKAHPYMGDNACSDLSVHTADDSTGGRVFSMATIFTTYIVLGTEGP